MMINRKNKWFRGFSEIERAQYILFCAALQEELKEAIKTVANEVMRDCDLMNTTMLAAKTGEVRAMRAVVDALNRVSERIGDER